MYSEQDFDVWQTCDNEVLEFLCDFPIVGDDTRMI